MLPAKLGQKRSESVSRKQNEEKPDLSPTLGATQSMPPKGYAGLQSMPDPNSVQGLSGAGCIPFTFHFNANETAKSSKGASRPQLETRNMLERIQSQIDETQADSERMKFNTHSFANIS